jgi:hypothetical protein
MLLSMKSCLRSFNIYLLAAAALGGGCGSNYLSPNKEYATLSIFLEGRPADSLPVQIGPDKATVYVAPAAVLTEEDLAKARLVDNPDGSYAIQLTFDDNGKLVLEMQTTSNPGKSLIIFAKFPPKGWREPEDGDPIPRNGLANGSLVFIPDASHAEAEHIVRGLNNMASAMNKQK